MEGFKNSGEGGFFPCHKIRLAFKRTEYPAKIFRLKCSHADFEKLCRAFFMKE